jgi:cytochrome o ubiquinol oxidase operon protein cyoD
MSGTQPAAPDHDGSRGGHDPEPAHEGADHGEEGGASHATLKGYLTGFALSVALTAVPFWLVMAKVIANPGALAGVLLFLGAVQIVVHMVYFLHMDAKSEGGWNMLALIFTAVLLVITLSGSLWIMFHLNQNMMPISPQQMRNMP